MLMIRDEDNIKKKTKTYLATFAICAVPWASSSLLAHWFTPFPCVLSRMVRMTFLSTPSL